MCYFEKKKSLNSVNFSKSPGFQNCEVFKIARFSKSRGFQNCEVFKIARFSKSRGFQNHGVLKITGFSIHDICMLENTDRLLNSCKTVFKYIVIGFVNPIRHFPRARTWIALRGLGGRVLRFIHRISFKIGLNSTGLTSITSLIRPIYGLVNPPD